MEMVRAGIIPRRKYTRGKKMSDIAVSAGKSTWRCAASRTHSVVVENEPVSTAPPENEPSAKRMSYKSVQTGRFARLLREICSGGGAAGGTAWVSDQVSRRIPKMAVAVGVTAPSLLS